MSDIDVAVPGRPVFLQALRATFKRVPLWLMVWFVPLVCAALLAAPWLGWFDATLAHRYEPGSVLFQLDTNFRFDHKDDLGSLGAQSAALLAGLAFVMMMLGAFSAGGWLQVFLERTRGNSIRRFLWGGARYFWRFFRVWIFTVLVLALLSWTLYGWPWETVVLDILAGATDGDLELLDSERTVVHLQWLQGVLYAAGLGLILAWGDYTRTRLALHGASSAVFAGVATAFLILVHPIRTLRPFLLLFVVEFALVRGLGALSWSSNANLSSDSGWHGVLYLFVLGQLAMMVQAILRGARYHAAVQVSRKLVPAIEQPDPWAHRVGGPGGPQYPIDDDDEYGVSI